jgi:hypothetical protein
MIQAAIGDKATAAALLGYRVGLRFNLLCDLDCVSGSTF